MGCMMKQRQGGTTVTRNPLIFDLVLICLLLTSHTYCNYLEITNLASRHDSIETKTGTTGLLQTRLDFLLCTSHHNPKRLTATCLCSPVIRANNYIRFALRRRRSQEATDEGGRPIDSIGGRSLKEGDVYSWLWLAYVCHFKSGQLKLVNV
jgi:hypothetical protein